MAEASYVLRFFFDAGSGVCLWSANEAAHERYGYAVDVDSLSLSGETREAVEALLRAYDAGFNWDDPAGADLWSPAEAQAFEREAEAVLKRLRTELGSSFDVRDERR